LFEQETSTYERKCEKKETTTNGERKIREITRRGPSAVGEKEF